jgi:hypothetical protein
VDATQNAAKTHPLSGRGGLFQASILSNPNGFVYRWLGNNHPVSASKEGGLFLYGADTLLSRRGNLLADTSSSGLLGRV